MCLINNTRVLTSRGYKSVQLLSESDLVFVKGEWKRIIGVDDSTYSGPIISIVSAASSNPIHVTPEQPFLTKTLNSTGFEEGEYVLSERSSWTPAVSLRAGKHLLCLPIEKKEISAPISIQVGGEVRDPLDIDWFMVGFYFGKGDRVLDVEFIPPGWSVLKEFSLNSNTCNHIPEWVQRLPVDDIKVFISGFKKSANRISGCYEVANESVALSVQRLYAKLHRFVRIHLNENIVCINELNNDQVSFDDEFMYIPVVAISDKQRRIVTYSTHINGDNSYVIENVAIKH